MTMHNSILPSPPTLFPRPLEQDLFNTDLDPGNNLTSDPDKIWIWIQYEFSFLFVVLLKFCSVNDETLLYIMLFKFAIFVFASIQISLKSKFYIMLCILSPYSLIFIGSAHFSEINFYLIKQIELIGFILWK